jgi:hypothetical protein
MNISTELLCLLNQWMMMMMMMANCYDDIFLRSPLKSYVAIFIAHICKISLSFFYEQYYTSFVQSLTAFPFSDSLVNVQLLTAFLWSLIPTLLLLYLAQEIWWLIKIQVLF